MMCIFVFFNEPYGGSRDEVRPIMRRFFGWRFGTRGRSSTGPSTNSSDAIPRTLPSLGPSDFD